MGCRNWVCLVSTTKQGMVFVKIGEDLSIGLGVVLQSGCASSSYATQSWSVASVPTDRRICLGRASVQRPAAGNLAPI
jgi:hypothetical protein